MATNRFNTRKYREGALPPINYEIFYKEEGVIYKWRGNAWRNLATGAMAPKTKHPELMQEFRRSLSDDRSGLVFPNKDKNTTFAQSLDKLKLSTIKRNARKSEKWYQNKIQKGGFDKRQIKSTPEIGKIYTSVYRAKGRDTDLIWDKNPIFLCTDLYTKNGKRYCAGINFHFVDIPVRLKLLQALQKIEKGTGRNRKMKVTYEFLKGASQFKEVKPCLKTYFLKSKEDDNGAKFVAPLVEVAPEEYELMISLPVQRFLQNGKFVSAREVYANSKRNKF